MQDCTCVCESFAKVFQSQSRTVPRHATKRRPLLGCSWQATLERSLRVRVGRVLHVNRDRTCWARHSTWFSALPTMRLLHTFNSFIPTSLNSASDTHLPLSFLEYRSHSIFIVQAFLRFTLFHLLLFSLVLLWQLFYYHKLQNFSNFREAQASLLLCATACFLY